MFLPLTAELLPGLMAACGTPSGEIKSVKYLQRLALLLNIPLAIK
jgi:hypothetical protein